ncbi:hypothetical protein N2152v2_000861 [Parachlorella kessleri]
MADQPMNTEQTQRSLWLGDLAPWMDEAFLFNLFVGTGQLVSVKLIRNRATGASEGYSFLEFRTHEAADTILKTYNGQTIPGTDQVFRLNWAAYGVGKTAPAGEDFSLFVGDLAPDVTDIILQEYFRQFYPSVRSAKVITDAGSGRSKGYGFVRFASEPERDKALTEMNGHFLSNRPIRVSLATAKKNANATTASAVQAPHPSDFDPTNTTLFIGGLSPSVSEEALRAVFARFGDIIYVKIPQGKGCGFVQFVLRTAAEQAMSAMNGQVLGNSALRISWGRSSSRAAHQAAQQVGPAGGFGGGLPAGPYPQGFDSAAAAAMAGYHQQLGAVAMPMAAYGPAAFAGAGASQQDLWAYQTAASLTIPPAANGAAPGSYSSSGSLAALVPAAGPAATAAAGSAGPAGAAAAAAGVAGAAGPSGQQQLNGKQAADGTLVDPLGPVNVEKMNAAYVSKHQPALLGTHLFTSFLG